MQDKVIVITGASEGIGLATAEELARRGVKGLVLASRRPDQLAAIAHELGDHVLAVPTDVTRRGDLERLRDAAIERFGQLDVMINNAGRAISRMVSELTDSDLEEMFTVNVKSVLYGIQAVLPYFKQRGHGQIVAISSGLSRFPTAPFRSAYSAAKGSVNMLMSNLRMELVQAHPGIKITTVLPGVVATNFGLNALHGGPDNRKLPGAQPVEEVATVIADVIERPRGEVYTRPQMLQLAARYFSAEDIDTVEAQPPFTR